jgi:hypothetical protein
MWLVTIFLYEIVSYQTLAFAQFWVPIPNYKILLPTNPQSHLSLLFFFNSKPCSGVPPCCIHQLKLNKPITSFHLFLYLNSKTAYHTSFLNHIPSFPSDPTKSESMFPCPNRLVPTNSKSIFHPIHISLF